MKKKRSTPSLSLTTLQERDLDRFGCTLDGKTVAICVDWRGKRVDAASKSRIIACLCRLDVALGPLLFFLAVEVSSVRPLPHYCYYPFDLKKGTHRKFLARLVDTGEIKFSFISDGREIQRIYNLSPYLHTRAKEVYSAILHYQNAGGIEAYDLERGIHHLENGVWLPKYFERFSLESEVQDVIQKLKKSAGSVPQAKKEVAKEIVAEGSAILKQFCENNTGTVRMIGLVRPIMVFIENLQVMYFDNTQEMIVLMTDLLAGNESDEELKNLGELLKILRPLAAISSSAQSGQGSAKPADLPKVPAELPGVIELMVAKGASWHLLERLFELLGVRVTSLPGRPVADYSREYENKVLGKNSWSEVARQALEDKPELRNEFGGRGWDALHHSEREKVRNRVRQGVTTYAKRMGKPLPPPQDD